MQNYTIRAVLWSYQKNKAEIYPIKIAITHNRKVTYVLTPHRVHIKQWRKDRVKDHPEANLINADIQRRISEINKDIIVRNLEGLPVTRRSLLAQDRQTERSFKHFAEEVDHDAKEISRIITFAGSGLSLRDIDVTFLRKYEQHERERGMAQNTLNTSFKYLRRVLNKAHAEGLIKSNPMDNYEIPRYVQSERLFLIKREREAFVKLLDKKMPESIYRTLCYFLLGCYSGLRHSDWMKFDPDRMVDGSLLRLRPHKTVGTSGEWVVLPIGPTLEEIIARIRAIDRKPLTNQKSNEKLKLLAMMAEVDKEVTTHTGRHSFGYLCASLGMPKSTTAELLGVNIRTVDVYYHLAGEDIRLQAAPLMNV